MKGKQVCLLFSRKCFDPARCVGNEHVASQIDDLRRTELPCSVILFFSKIWSGQVRLISLSDSLVHETFVNLPTADRICSIIPPGGNSSCSLLRKKPRPATRALVELVPGMFLHGTTRRKPYLTWNLAPIPCFQQARHVRRNVCSRRGVNIVAENVSKVVDGPIHPAGDEESNTAQVILRDIHLSYGGNPILKGLNLEIRRGEATAIIGTSGTGKSTTLRVITGLSVPDSGDVIIRGWRRTKSIAWQRGPNRVSMVFQSAALFDSMTVLENVAFSLLREGKTSDDRIIELVTMFLRRVGLEDAMYKFPEQLSGGMKKRVSLARAIIYDTDKPETAPDILLYDEPTAGLDPTASTRIEDIIRSLQDVCPTCIVVTHQFSTIRRTADRVVLMHDGRIVWDGPVQDLDTTEDPYVRQFMSGSTDGPLSSADNTLETPFRLS